MWKPFARQLITRLLGCIADLHFIRGWHHDRLETHRENHWRKKIGKGTSTAMLKGASAGISVATGTIGLSSPGAGRWALLKFLISSIAGSMVASKGVKKPACKPFVTFYWHKQFDAARCCSVVWHVVLCSSAQFLVHELRIRAMYWRKLNGGWRRATWMFETARTWRRFWSINRKPSGYMHPSLKELIHADFFQCRLLPINFGGLQCCYFCPSFCGHEEEVFQQDPIRFIAFLQNVGHR